MADTVVETQKGGATRTTETHENGTKVTTTKGGSSGNSQIKVTTSSGDSATIHVNGKTGEIKVTRP